MPDDVMVRPLSRPLTPPMSPDNATKMQELYGDKPDPMVRPLSRPIQKSMGESTIAELGRRESDTLSKYTGGVKEALTRPLTETGSSIAKIGEVGSRIGGAATDVLGTVISPIEAGIKTGVNRAIPTVAGELEKVLPANYKASSITPKKRENLTQDIGDVATGVALTPTALGKVGDVAKGLGEAKELVPGVKSAERIDSAAIRANGQVYPGKSHVQIRAEHNLKGGEEGFVTNTRQFISRKKALPIAQNAGQIQQETKNPGQLHSEDIGRPAPLEGTPEDVSNALYRMSNADEARRANAVQNLKTIKDVDNATWEKLYAYKDDPKLELTPQEQALYKQHIEPVAARSDELRAKLAKAGVPTGDFGEVGAAPRKVKGKNAYIEKLYGTVEAKNTPAKGGKGFSTYAATLKPRSMFAVASPSGAREIVFIKDGAVYKNGEHVGDVLDKDVTPRAGVDTSVGKIQQATTDEIEKATKIEYHKNLLANEYTNWQALERANDAHEFLQQYKDSPEFKEYATKTSNAPEGWRSLHTQVENKEFAGWKFDPKMAEVFEDYLGNIKGPEDYTTAIMNIAKATKASIFWNPIKHMVNATNMFAVSQGLVGGAKELANLRLPYALIDATKEVLTQGKEFRTAVAEGLSTPGMRTEAQKFHEELVRAMGRSVQSDPQAFARLAKQWGYNSTVGMVKALYSGSSKLLWAYSDILTYARYKQYRVAGLSARDAVAKVHQVMPSYRIPSRVAGSRSVSRALQNPSATMFGRYAYNRMANLADMAKRSAATNLKDRDAWEARDQLVALAAITTVGYKVVDKMLQEATGDPNAHYGMGGFSTAVDVAKGVGEGRKTLPQAAQSLFAPGLMALPLEAGLNQNLYTGKPIVQRGDWNSFIEGGQRGTDAARMGFDIGEYAAGKFSPLQVGEEAAKGENSIDKILLEQLGASFPKDTTKAEKYSRAAAKTANKKRPEFVP